MDWDDLPSALLTPNQRRMLRGEADLTKRGERSARSRIRERLRASIFDMQLIVSALDIDDIDDALTEPDEYEPELGSSPPLLGALPPLATIVYLASTRDGDEENIPPFLHHVGEGMKIGVNRRGKTVEDCEIEGELQVGEPLDERARGDLSELPEHVLKQLLMADEITSDEYSEAWKAKQEVGE